MIARSTLALALALFASISQAAEVGQPCTAKLSGAVSGSFPCTIIIRAKGSGAAVLTLSPKKLPKNVKAFTGEFEIEAPVKAQAYGMAALKSARTLLTTARHKTYVAAKAKEPRGDVTVTVEKVQAAEAHSTQTLNGKIDVQLVRDRGAPADRIRMDVKF